VNPETGKQTDKRRAYRTVLDILFHSLVRYAAPIIPFTAAEVWKSRFGQANSVHMLDWPEVDAGWKNEALQSRWYQLRSYRDVVNEAIEPHRREKVVRSSLEAFVRLHSNSPDVMALIDSVDFDELCIISGYEWHGKIMSGDGNWIDPPTNMVFGVAGVAVTDDHKCGRCWRHLPEVSEHGDLCGRCEDILA
jgi:isoleucyl-tRNA synthetase